MDSKCLAALRAVEQLLVGQHERHHGFHNRRAANANTGVVPTFGLHVHILPEAVHGECALANAMIAASAEFGDVAHEVRDATRDGAVTAAERARITDAIDEAMTALVELRAMVWREGEQA